MLSSLKGLCLWTSEALSYTVSRMRCHWMFSSFPPMQFPTVQLCAIGNILRIWAVREFTLSSLYRCCTSLVVWLHHLPDKPRNCLLLRHQSLHVVIHILLPMVEEKKATIDDFQGLVNLLPVAVEGFPASGRHSLWNTLTVTHAPSQGNQTSRHVPEYAYAHLMFKPQLKKCACEVVITKRQFSLLGPNLALPGPPYLLWWET